MALARDADERQRQAVESQLDLNALALDGPVRPIDIPSAPNSKSRFAGIEKQLLRKMTIAALVVLAVGGLTAGIVTYMQRQADLKSAAQGDTSKLNSQYDTVNIPLSAFSKADAGTLSQAAVLTINGRLVVNNTLVLAPVNQPANGITGQLYYDKSSNKLRYYNGTEFVDLLDSQAAQPQTLVGGLSGAINLGAGLSSNGGTLSNSGVTSLQGLSGNVSLTAGRGVTIAGTTISADGIQNVTAGDGIVIASDGNGGITVTNSLASNPSYDFSTLPANGIVVSNGDGTLVSVGSTGPGQCLVSTNGAPVWQPCPGNSSVGTVTTAGGTPGRIAKFSGTLELDDSLLSETGSTVNIAGDINLSAGFRFFIGGQQLATANLADAADICKVSSANCAPATGSFIQNGTVQQAAANFNISGSGTAATLNATGALQLGGLNINTAGTLSNVAYLNQANTFTGSLTVGGGIRFTGLGAGIVSSNGTGTLSSGTLDRNNPTLLSGVLTVANGGTGLGLITANGLIYGNGTNTAGVTAAGTAGQIVIANASQVPTFVSISGDIGISASGVVALGNGVVTNAKLANSSLSVVAGSNLTGGGLVALGGSITIDITNAPSFSGSVNSIGGYQLNGSTVITSAGVLQGVTANANIITSGTLPVARGGTGVSALPGNGQLLVGNGSGYQVAGLTAGSGVVITNGAGSITVSLDNTVCTTAGNCNGGPVAGSNFYIQNGTAQQVGSNFNVDGTGVASIFNAVSALQLNGVSINTAGTLSNVAYLNQNNAFGGDLSVSGNVSVGSGSVTLGSLGTGLVQANASGVLSSSALSRNSALLVDTLSITNGGTGLSATPTNGQLLIGNGSGYSLMTLTGDNGITITNAAGAVTIGLNNTVCTSTAPCESPPSAGSTSYIQNGTVQQAGADFNISGGGAADTFNARTALQLNGVSINTAGTLSNVAYLNQANTFDGNLSVAGSNTLTVGTGVVRFGSLSTGIVQSSAAGVLSSSAIDRNNSSFFSNVLSTANGGTGNSTFTVNGLLFGNGPASLGVTAAGVGGQILVANASGVPSFVSVSGDIAISAAGVTTIQNGSVTNSKLANSSLTVTAGTNLTGGGLVALGDTITLNVASAPTFSGNVDAASFSRGGTTVITSSSVLQNVTANANIITSGTLPITRGGTGVTALPGNGQLLIGNGSGYDVATLTAGSGVVITNAAGAITVSIDNSVCTTANNCPNPAPGSSFYIQNGTGQQTTANFNIDGVGIATVFNAVTAYRLNGVDINDAGTLSNVAYLNQSNTFTGSLTLSGSNNLTVANGTVTFGGLGAGLVQTNGAGVLSSGAASRNNSTLFSDTLSIANGGTGVTATPAAGQLLIGNGTGYTVATLTAGSGVSITNAAGAITVAVNSSVCSSSNPCTSPPTGGSTNYIQNGTVQQASADFNISGGGTATTFNATGALQLNGSNINTAGTLSNVAYLNQANSFSGSLTVATGNLTVSTGSVTFGGLGAGIVQTDAGGALSSGQVDRNSASLFTNNLNVANGGTGRASLAANGLLFGNGTGAVNSTNVGSSGQLLLADAAGVPTFVSVSGDIAISATGVTTIQNSSVTNAKLANSSITINGTANITGGGTVALGGSLTLSVASSPSFTGTINAAGGYQLNGNDVITAGGVLQNVTANADIITSGTFGIGRGGTGLTSVPTNGQLLIGNGTGYALTNLTQGGGITITNGAGSISVAIDSTVCTTANNCGYQTGGGGSGDYIQNGTSLQSGANFNISGAGIAGTLNATTALQTAGTTRIDASGNVTAANVTANGAAVFTAVTTGTTALSVKAASGSGDIFNVKTTVNASALYVSSTGVVNMTLGVVIAGGLSVSGGITTNTDIKFSNSGFTNSLTTETLTAARTLTLPNASGTLCTTGTCIQNSATLQTAANLYIQSGNGGNTVARFRAAAGQTAPILRIDDSAGTVLSGFSAAGQLFNQSGIYTGTLVQASLTANRSYTLPDASGTVCLDSNNCGYLTTTAASTSYIQNTSTQQAGSNFNISGAGVIGTSLNVGGSTSLSGSVGVGIAPSSNSSLRVQATSTSAALQVWSRSGNTGDVFVVANQDGDRQLRVTPSGVLILGNSSSTYQNTGTIRIQDGLTNGFYGQLTSGTGLTANRTFTLPDADGVLCTTATCAVTGSGSFINNGTAQQTGANFNISGDGTIGSSLTVIGSTSLAGTLTAAANTVTIQGATNTSSSLRVNNAAGTNNSGTIFNIDTTATSLVTNGSFESDTAGWSANGANASISRTTSQSVYGTTALQITTTGTPTANSGAKYAVTLASNTTYTLSAYMRVSTGGLVAVGVGGYSLNNTTNTVCVTGQILTSTSWATVTCTFTTGTITAAPTYIFFGGSDTTARTYYLDGVWLEASGASSGYRDATISLNGTITSPLVIQPASDMSSALKVSDSSGNSVLNVDTLLALTSVRGALSVSNNISTPLIDAPTGTALSIGTNNATSITLGTTSMTGTTTLGRSNQTNTVNIANATIAAGQTGTVNIATNATGTGKTAVTVGSTNGASATTIQSGTGGLNLNSGTGSTTLKSSSTTGFQVQDGNYGTPLINVDTATASNLVQYASFEAGTTTPTGWTAVGTPSSFTKNNNNSNAYDGSGSLRLATAATAGQGFRGSLLTSLGASTYTASFYAMMDSGTMASNLWQITTTGGATSNATCAAGVTLNASGFQRINCTVTTTGTTNAISITQTDATARIVYIDAASFTGAGNYAYQQLGSIQLMSAINSPVLFQNASNSTSAFQIQSNLTNTYLFVADTLNNRIGIGTNAAAYTLDVVGDINSSTGYRINGVAGSSVTCSGGNVLQNQVVSGGITTGGSCISIAPASGSTNYIQNGTVQQTANMNIISQNTSSVTARLQAVSGQTVDILQVYNDSGVKTFSINQFGTAGFTGVGVNAGNIAITSGGASTRPLYVRAASGQIADLFQLLNSGNTVVSGFNANGQLYNQSGSFTGTLAQATLTANRTYTLPDESGTICLQNSANCGFLTGSASSYIQNGTTQQASSNFNISGAGVIGSTLDVSGASTFTGAVTANGGVSTNQMSVTNTNTAAVASSIRAVSGQTADSFQVQDASGNKLTSVAADGSLSVGIAANTSIVPTFTKLANPATLPTGNGTGTAWSPDGQYMSVTHATTPYVTIYKRSGSSFTKLANPATLPTGNGTGTAWSPDGQYMSVTHATSPFVTIYKRSGDTFTKLANPATLPGGNAYGASFSQDGQYMSVAHDVSPFVTIYKRSGDTFTKLANPATLPGGNATGTTWSPDGQYMTVSHTNPPYITIYKRSGDTFTKLANPATLPTGTGFNASFSPDGQYLSVAHSSLPQVTIYKRSGDTFTKLSDPATLPVGYATGTAWSPDGQYMTVSHNSSPYITIYKRIGDTFTKLANPASLPSGFGSGTAWSPDGQYMSVSSQSFSTYIHIYSVSAVSTITNTPTLANLTVAGRACIGTDNCNDTLSVSGTVGVQGFLTTTNLNVTNYLQTGGYTRLDASGNLMNINDISSNGIISSNLLDVKTGLRIAGIAASGQFLRGDGTNFVSSTLQASDIVAGSTNYIQNGTAVQALSNFNISGAGVIGGNFTVGGLSTFNQTVTINSTGGGNTNGLVLNGTHTYDTVYTTRINGETGYRFIQDADGRLNWGPGDNTTDVYIARDEAGILSLNGSLRVGGATGTSSLNVAASGSTIAGSFNSVNGSAINAASTNGNGIYAQGAYGIIAQGSQTSALFQSLAANNANNTVVIKASIGQAGDLLNLQNASSSVLAKFDVSGALTAAGLNTSGNINQSGGLMNITNSGTIFRYSGTGGDPFYTLQIQDSSSNTLFDFDTSGSILSIGRTYYKSGVLRLAGGDFDTNITAVSNTQRRNIVFPDADGTVCLNTGNCGTGSSGSYIVNGTSVQSANFNVSAAGSSGDAFRIAGNNAGGTYNILNVVDGQFGRSLLSVHEGQKSVVIDASGINYGGLDYALRFGSFGSGEGIASNRSGGNTLNGLSFFTGNNLRMAIRSTGNVCIGNDSCTAKLGVTGTIAASGSITANTTPDIAEMIAAAPDVEAADVVMADPGNTERVIKASGVYNSAAIGVISDGTSSFMINSYGGIAGGKPLVLAGRVPVKVTNESGDIKPGDHLTVSSTTGHAMKATRAGATIGTALGFFNGTTGTVLVLVNPSYFDPFDGNNLQASTATISTLNATNATITNLTVGTLNVTGNITVGGHIITAGNTPVITQNTALCTDTVLTINGNDTAGEIVVTTGTGCANSGLATGTLGSVAFSTPYTKAPRIVMTPSNSKAATLSKTFIDGDTITANGFNIDTLDALAPGTTYRWYYHSLE